MPLYYDKRRNAVKKRYSKELYELWVSSIEYKPPPGETIFIKLGCSEYRAVVAMMVGENVTKVSSNPSTYIIERI